MCIKVNFNPHFIPYTKNKSKWTIRLNVKLKIILKIKRNRKKKSHGVGDDFLDIT